MPFLTVYFNHPSQLFNNSLVSTNFSALESLFRKIFPEMMTKNVRECDKNFERLQKALSFSVGLSILKGIKIKK